MKNNLHTDRSYDLELQQLVEMLRSMSQAVELQLVDAFQLILHPEAGKAKQIIRKDRSINEQEKKIYTVALKIIALRHPVAIDLRQTLVAQRLAGELERIADYAKNIARRGEIAIGEDALQEVPVGITKMFDTVLEMIRSMEYDYNKISIDDLIKINKRDDEIDQYYNSLFRELVTYMIEKPHSISACAQLLFVGRHLERIGDLIGSMAENIYFTITGKDLDQVGGE